MVHVPILRSGVPYESVAKIELYHHATGAPVATVSQANSGMIVRDLKRMGDDVLDRFTVQELLARCLEAAELFLDAKLPVGGSAQSFDEYIACLSATTGMPVTYCRNNAGKINHVLSDMGTILGGLTRGFDLTILDTGYGQHQGGLMSFHRVGRTFGAVLPSNSPGVHGLWIPAVALKTPIVLKPGREEPWTPLRIIEALAAAGMPREAFGFYPTDHAGAAELLRLADRSMLFGDESTTRPWKNDPRVEIHGPGHSKIVLGDDCADDWERYLDLMVSSITANAGRSCVNASGVWTPKHGRAIAEALAKRLAKIEALPADDPNASVAAFANPTIAERISALIDNELGTAGAADLTTPLRGSSRIVPPQTPLGERRIAGRCAYLLPTVIWCEDRAHSLANREFLFPYVAVVQCPTADIPSTIGPTLVVTAITGDGAFRDALMAAPNVDRLNVGAIPTWRIRWDQPHEGNLFEHLYRQRALQIEPAA